MGQIKNIKLHIVTDIKGLELKHFLKTTHHHHVARSKETGEKVERDHD